MQTQAVGVNQPRVKVIGQTQAVGVNQPRVLK